MAPKFYRNSDENITCKSRVLTEQKEKSSIYSLEFIQRVCDYVNIFFTILCETHQLDTKPREYKIMLTYSFN